MNRSIVQLLWCIFSCSLAGVCEHTFKAILAHKKDTIATEFLGHASRFRAEATLWTKEAVAWLLVLVLVSIALAILRRERVRSK